MFVFNLICDWLVSIQNSNTKGPFKNFSYFLTGFPFFVSGRSSSTGQFFPTHVSLSSHEDTDAWKKSYNFVKNVNGKNPKFRMGDGAWDITKAGNEVFGDDGVRLMCWPHTYRNIVKNLAAVRKAEKVVADRIVADIEELQWSAHNEETFRYVCNLIAQKYSAEVYSATTRDAVNSFFEYFNSQWVESPTFRWYEGAHPWAISNNQGIEGVNKDIKAGHTFKRRCPLGTFFNIVQRMIRDFSLKNDDMLFTSRIKMLDHPDFILGLKLKTDGYQWLKSMNVCSGDKMVCINPVNKYTVSEHFHLGKVDKIWAVTSSSNTLDLGLKARAKVSRSRHLCFKDFV